jgi:hypothetical protein
MATENLNNEARIGLSRLNNGFDTDLNYEERNLK